MQALGYLSIVAGFLGGSYAAVVRQEGVPVASYVAALAARIVGVALVRTVLRRAARHEATLAANIGSLERSLADVVTRAAALARAKREVDVYDLRQRIDEEFARPLDDFVQAREALAHSYGLQAYADVMNPFAAGERYLNRVWSTSTDGYIDEAHIYIDKAHEQFDAALRAFRDLTARGAPGRPAATRHLARPESLERSPGSTSFWGR
ncbi:MAG: hypothetical protein HY657_00700 [Acidobacteria bacterium]|nr:hypothetical protein [Acidobacteriota bacterium]